MSSIRRYYAPLPIVRANFDTFGLNKAARIAAHKNARDAGLKPPMSLDPPPPFTMLEFDAGFFQVKPSLPNE